MTANAEQSENMELVWGATEIAKVIGRSARSTFHLLERGDLPARKVGSRWVADRGNLVEFFRKGVAA